MFQLPVFGRNLIWDGFSFSKWWSGKWSGGVVDGWRFGMKGRRMEFGCMVWYGMVFFSFSFLFLLFFLSFVHQLNGVSWGCGNERERERERKGERERSASKQRAAMYTFIISHLSLASAYP